MTALLEYNQKILTVLLECIGILCKFSKPDWFLETCETPLEMPLYSCTYVLSCLFAIRFYSRPEANVPA